jgi:hypothetical protein
VNVVETDSVKEQIAFARHNFDNLQALIRQSDAKAAAAITLIVFLAATTLGLAKDAFLALQVGSVCQVIFSTIFLLAGVVFLGAFAGCIWSVQQVMQPRGARHYPATQTGRDLMWQDHIILHGNNDEYFEAMKNAEPLVLLRNLTNQVFELAHISKEKMDALKNGKRAAWVAFGSWLVCAVAGLVLVRIK